TMKGEDVIGLFEEQWQPEGARNAFLHLGISDEIDVVYDSNAERGEHVKSIKVDGQEIEEDKDYRVATLSFLAAGGDNFTSFAKGDFEQSGLTDFDTWTSYFEKNTPVAPDKNERQADLAEDVIDNGELEADLTGPKTIEAGDSTEFVLETTAESEVPGPVDVTVDLPEGFTSEAAGATSSPSAKAPEVSPEENETTTITLDSIPAGESETPVTVTAPEDASGEVTVNVSLQANAEGPWWDDNPLPLAHEFEATASVSEDADASAGDNGGADGGAADGDDSAAGGDSAADGADGSSDAGSGSAGGSADGGSADGAGADANGSGSDANGSKDGGDLPRTGFETANVVAAALALIVAGSAVVTMVRRRRIGI